MGFAIVSLVIGAIIFIYSIFMGPNSAVQQTVQYLSFIWSSVFLAGGLVIMAIKSFIAEMPTGTSSNSSSALNISTAPRFQRQRESKKCKKCGKTIDSGYTACPHCGASDFE